jgi:hypothetical protein
VKHIVQRRHVAALVLFVMATVWGKVVLAQDTPIRLGQGQDLQSLTGENAFPLQITGFAVGNYTFDARTKANTFAASKIAVSLFRELNDYVWVFGQLTTLLEDEGIFSEEAAAEEEVVTETEIDNLILNLTVPGASNVSIGFGKFDMPVGFERDDEPLNLEPSRTFNFELGRPIKITGVVARIAVSPKVDLTLLGGNGWESQIDPNKGKTGAARLGLLPAEGVSFGFSAVYGSEGAAGEANDRFVLDVDYALQPSENWIIAGEADYGGDRGVGAASDMTWGGGTLTVFRRFLRGFGVAARAEVFDDPDGARTGTPQTLTSYTLAPLYFIGTGREGIFANIEHTTFRIPRFQLRGEVRVNHSTEAVFETSDGESQWGTAFALQLVATF